MTPRLKPQTIYSLARVELEAATGKPVRIIPFDETSRITDEELAQRILLAADARHPDARVVLPGNARDPNKVVYRGPRNLSADDRRAKIIPGLSVRQLLMRGMTRRQIREAVNEGWVRLQYKAKP